jgi:tetratricopeptide (TPR) repeat protein
LTLTASIDLELMRASMLLETDPAAAAALARAVLTAHPGQDAATLLLAAACRRLGNSAGTIEAMEAMGRNQPDSALLQLELGRAYAACGRAEEATVALQRALKLDETLADAWADLSMQWLLSGETAAADAAYIQYRRLTTNPPDLADAYLAFDQQRFEVAEGLARQRLDSGTNPVAALTLLAAIASARGDELAEEAALTQALRIASCDSVAREQLAKLMVRQGRTDEALALIERLLNAEPQSRSVLILKAEALQAAERLDEGLSIILGLLTEHPNDADLWVIAGNQQRFSGHARDAIAAYRRALDLQPGNGLAYWALANLDALSEVPQIIETLGAQLAAADLARFDGTCLEFALGKALEDRRDFAGSFQHYERGNRRARSSFNYDANATTAFVERFKATFSPAFFQKRADWGSAAIDPIFIVGMPRSGSTLLEQILASHSSVEGTRELPHMPTIARELAGPPQTAARYPDNLPELGESEIDALAARYLRSASTHRLAGRPRFIDKMHGNFVSLGLIHLMFPRAVIIDSRRHPLACGFACYKQLFSAGMNFAYDLKEMGLFYRDYVELMAHIDAVLPGRVHRVYYERLVANTEEEVRRLLEACSLPFESQCLRFHETARVAQTASSEQVRRPMYSQGVDHWRHYQPWLGPLQAALGKLIDEYPAAR